MHIREIFKKTKLLSILWIIVILILLLMPTNKISEKQLFPFADKVVHFGLFFILSALNSIDSNEIKVKYRIIIAVTFALITELMQLLLTNYRMFDIVDILADSLGYISSIIVVKLLYKYKILKTL